jgi:hypothetical protein
VGAYDREEPLAVLAHAGGPDPVTREQLVVAVRPLSRHVAQ